jgi:predicted double-glycine peptidase
MPSKLGIAFSGMMVGGVAFLIAGTAVYLTTDQLQNISMARLQDRTVQEAKLQDRVTQTQGPAESTSMQYARFQPSQ